MESSEPIVDFYWRPGCVFCMALTANLKLRRIRYVKHNIWKSEPAAALVRAAANGNETVPTIVIGDKTLVNPSGAAVAETLAGASSTGD